MQLGGQNALYTQMKKDCKACHETINQLLSKEWSILTNHFHFFRNMDWFLGQSQI